MEDICNARASGWPRRREDAAHAKQDSVAAPLFRLFRLSVRRMRRCSPVLSLILLVSAGCTSGRKASEPAMDRSTGDSITELNLLASPVALNLDGVPGPDGFVLKVYPGNAQRPKPLPITAGGLEILMFDGILQETDFATTQPRRVWRYTTSDLKRYEVKTSIGTGYHIDPRWGDAKPARDKVTILSRYMSPQGKAVYSAPSVISVTVK